MTEAGYTKSKYQGSRPLHLGLVQPPQTLCSSGQTSRHGDSFHLNDGPAYRFSTDNDFGGSGG